MTSNIIASDWASEFGLALTPLFGPADTMAEGEHFVLLDGGNGSFALSITSDRMWKHSKPTNWSWSSDLSHHVTLTENEVGVVRWDKPNPEVFTRSSIDGKRNEFYQFLTADRVQSNRRVVSHFLEAYRRMRSLTADAGIPDAHSTDAFLELLSFAIERSLSADVSSDESPAIAASQQTHLLEALSEGSKSALLEFLLETDDLKQNLTLLPTLAIRHAGSEIFQEAHYELLRASAPDLFGHVGPAEAGNVSRGGAHFTPPALARSLTEEVLQQIPNLASRDSLVIMDPACGSGAFLHEAMRAIERTGFGGRLTLIGRDISASAISMAQFVMRMAKADWSPAAGVEIDLLTSDSLQERLPDADVVLMNPPFVSWSTMGHQHRDQMRTILGENISGRGDLSMAFVARALSALKPGGTIGALMPNSVLTLQSAQKWREWLVDEADIRFLGSLGDYGLFSYAMVQVAAVVMTKPMNGAPRSEMTKVLVAANEADSTSFALRQLRKHSGIDAAAVYDPEFRIFSTRRDNFSNSTTWNMTSPRTAKQLDRLSQRLGILSVGELFHVRQGVRTGFNAAFLLKTDVVNQLPKKERRWFKPAAINDSIIDGELLDLFSVFYPYSNDGLSLNTEADLAQAVPTYSTHYLIPNKERLANRAGHIRANRSDWWGLSERRATWSLDRSPRIISKYFGGPGGFALDLNANWIVVQGFAWFPKWDTDITDRTMEAVLSTEHILSAYSAIFNSRSFHKLMSHFSPHVAGGQFDLSPRYVNAIPLPDLQSLATGVQSGRLISLLAELGSKPNPGSTSWMLKTDRLVCDLYGLDLNDLD